MNYTKIKNEKRERRHKRIRAKVTGTKEMPRLCVYKSNQYVYAQIIDDTTAKTLAYEASNKKDGTKLQGATKVGVRIAEKAKALKISKVVFDRGGFIYTGKIKALADAARGGGLTFLNIMDKDTNTIIAPDVATAAPAPVVAPTAPAASTDTRGNKDAFRGRGQGGQGGPKRRDSRGGRAERPRSEFEQKIIAMRRVTRVVAGGRRFSFSVALVAGDKKGRVGVGLGKATDTSLAIDKALRDAKKHMIRVPLTKTNSIPHEVYAKYSSGRIFIKPAPGRGVVAGSAARSILELAGVKDVMAKIISPSKNQLNVAQAALKALQSLTPVKK